MTAATQHPDAPRAGLLHRLGMHSESLALWRQILTERPDFAAGWNDFANLLADLRCYDAAYSSYRQAIALAPAFAAAHGNLGNALMLTHAYGEAEAALGEAIRLDPGHAAAFANLGDALLAQDRVEEAFAAYRRAVELAPESPPVHLHYANALLLHGHLKEGFAHAEWRWKRRLTWDNPEACPLFGWQGEPLGGRTIRLFAEQGFGDAIQFARYATLVAERGGRVEILARKGLGRLLATVEGVAAVEEIGATVQVWPGRDCDLSLMTLPHLFGTDLDSIPARIPYVSADAGAVAGWQDRLAPLPGLKVGLVWAGDPRPHAFECALVDSRRSVALAELAPLAALEGISFVSLQKGEAAREARPDGLALFDAMDEMADFADTAALVEALDLVVTVDTAVAHLAAALGKPTWILSRHDGCWRWMQGRDDSPWYPGARLFRQETRDDWRETIARLAAALGGKAREARKKT